MRNIPFPPASVHPSSPSTGSDESMRHIALLTPQQAWRLIIRQTGGSLSKTTFYRWLNQGKLYSMRLGWRIYIPLESVNEVVKRCLSGERL